MKSAILVMVSCADSDQAERIGELLLKKKLAACVQVIPSVESVFLWPPQKNQLDYAKESVLLIKTLDTKWSSLEKTIINAHTYENPEIIAIPLLYVSKKYLAWLSSELS